MLFHNFYGRGHRSYCYSQPLKSPKSMVCEFELLLNYKNKLEYHMTILYAYLSCNANTFVVRTFPLRNKLLE